MTVAPAPSPGSGSGAWRTIRTVLRILLVAVLVVLLALIALRLLRPGSDRTPAVADSSAPPSSVTTPSSVATRSATSAATSAPATPSAEAGTGSDSGGGSSSGSGSGGSGGSSGTGGGVTKAPTTPAPTVIFTVPPTAECPVPSEGRFQGPTSVSLAIRWQSSGGTEGYFGVDTTDAQAAPYKIGQPNDAVTFDYPCPRASLPLTVTIVGPGGKTSRTVTVVNSGYTGQQ